MVKFEKRNGIEYVIKGEGEITVDDPVGKRLYERMIKVQPSTQLRALVGKSKTYREWIETLEAGQMTREEYEELKKRLRLKSVREDLDERAASRILRIDLIHYLFGDPEKLTEKQKRKLTEAAVTAGGFKEYIKPYLAERVKNLEIGDYKKKLLEVFETRKLIDLETLLLQLKMAIDFCIKSEFINNVKKVKVHGDKPLLDKLHDVYREGSVFDLWEVLKEFREKYP